MEGGNTTRDGHLESQMIFESRCFAFTNMKVTQNNAEKLRLGAAPRFRL